jgi:hypothetical protein
MDDIMFLVTGLIFLLIIFICSIETKNDRIIYRYLLKKLAHKKEEDSDKK